MERYQLPEMLFRPEAFIDKVRIRELEGMQTNPLLQTIPLPSTLSKVPDSETSRSLNRVVGLADLVHNSIFSLDVDHRAACLQNIVVIGGGSFLPGLTDRLNFELAQRIPGSKIKIHSPGNAIERKYSAWLGGSILASLGTFHQLWVGQDEWKEHGPNILRQRKSLCPSVSRDIN
jgi:actin-related protein